MPRKRQSGDGALYLDKKRQLWIGVVDNGFKPNGKRDQPRVTSKSQTVARQKLDDLKARIKRGTSLDNQTVAEWGSSWLEGECKAKLKPGALRSYRSIFNTWIEPNIGRLNLRDVRPSHLTSIYAKAKAKGRTGATQVKIHTVISSMFESARYERLVDHNVANDTRAPRVGRVGAGPSKALDAAQMRSVLTVAEEANHGTKWLVSLYAGLRQGERLGATVDSIDFTNNTFTVQWSLTSANFEHGCDGACGRPRAGNCPARVMVIPEGLDWLPIRGAKILVRPKSGETRTFHLPDGLMERLAAHVVNLAATDNPHGLLWPAADGKPMVDKADQKEWQALIAKAGVDLDTTTHWARHTAVSGFTEVGVPERIIGEIVGHKSAGITARYQHVSSAATNAAMDKLTDQMESLRAKAGEIPVRQERP